MIEDEKPRGADGADDPKHKAIDLSRPMQAHVVAVALREPGVMARVRPVLNPDIFDDDALSDVVSWSAQFWDEYKQTPSMAALRDVFPDQAGLIRSLWAEDLTDKTYTVDRITKFARSRAMKLAIVKSAEVIGCEMRGEEYRNAKGKVEKLDPIELVKQAAMVGRDMSEIGDDFHNTLDTCIGEYINPVQVEKLLTGMGHLDEAGVYLERGELGCVLGASKRGKSHVLTNIAYGALKQGLNVVYYSLEMASKKVLRRMHLRIAGPKADIRADPQAFGEVLRARQARLIKGRLLVKRYPSRGATPDDLRAHLTMVIAQGFVPDVVVVDYGSILRPNKATGEVRHDIAAIYLELRAIAGEFNVGMWSAAQANRGSVNKELVTMADFAECFEIVMHLDVGFSVCMTDDEKARNEGRFFILAARNEADGTIVTFNHDYSRSLITTTGVQAAVQEKRKRDKDTNGGPMANVEAAAQAARLRKQKDKQDNP